MEVPSYVPNLVHELCSSTNPEVTKLLQKYKPYLDSDGTYQQFCKLYGFSDNPTSEKLAGMLKF